MALAYGMQGTSLLVYPCSHIAILRTGSPRCYLCAGELSHQQVLGLCLARRGARNWSEDDEDRCGTACMFCIGAFLRLGWIMLLQDCTNLPGSTACCTPLPRFRCAALATKTLKKVGPAAAGPEKRKAWCLSPGAMCAHAGGRPNSSSRCPSSLQDGPGVQRCIGQQPWLNQGPYWVVLRCNTRTFGHVQRTPRRRSIPGAARKRARARAGLHQ